MEFLFNYFDKLPFLVSYVAGVLSFLSPCVLPLVPVYFFYITGISANEAKNGNLSKEDKLKIFKESVLFVFGFSIVFILLGVSAANLIGNIFSNEFVKYIAGIVVILFGIHIMGLFKFKFLQNEKRLHLEDVGSFLLGLSFAFGWTPCIGPIFGMIVSFASVEVNKSLFMMVLYSLGLATPFILMAIFSVWSLKFIDKIKRYLGIIEKISGLLLVGVGIYMILGG